MVLLKRRERTIFNINAITDHISLNACLYTECNQCMVISVIYVYGFYNVLGWEHFVAIMMVWDQRPYIAIVMAWDRASIQTL
jgi:hypothetical protein